ncbi:MAG: hypothetical protein WBD02_11055 [Acidimicrobiia bacterium]
MSADEVTTEIDARPGTWIVWFSWMGVLVTSVPLVLWKARVHAAGGWFTVMSLVVFGLGILVFVVCLVTAAYRTSQGDEIQVGSLFALGTRAPVATRRLLWLAFLGALAVAAFGASDNPFAVMIPMLQLGCVGLWAARHAAFPQRRATPWKGRR